VPVPAVGLEPGVDVLHERVPLHEHVREGGAGEDPHHPGGEGRQALQPTSIDPIQHPFLHVYVLQPLRLFCILYFFTNKTKYF
jgi:hypothetical protein